MNLVVFFSSLNTLKEEEFNCLRARKLKKHGFHFASNKIHEKMNLIFGKLKNTLIFCKLKNAEKAILLTIIFTKGNLRKLRGRSMPFFFPYDL